MKIDDIRESLDVVKAIRLKTAGKAWAEVWKNGVRLGDLLSLVSKPLTLDDKDAIALRNWLCMLYEKPPERKEEIKLKNGQIYLHDRVGNSRVEGGKYYLLRAHQTSGNWILIDINNPEFAWCSWSWTSGMEEIIKYNFTLCPHATITVNEND